MNKIKIVGVVIFVLSISLVILSNSISQHNKINNEVLNTINKQKAFTQEISKNIFYIYKNKDASITQLNNSIKKFIKKMDKQEKKTDTFQSDEIKNQTKKITLLWNSFYLKVQEFRDLSKITTAYSNVILQKTVKDIYNINIKLVVEFDKLTNMKQKYFEDRLKIKKMILYSLYIALLLMLIYFFAQLKNITSFIQKFLNTSKNIIKNSSIKELKPIKVQKDTKEIIEATNNFNFLVQKIDNSIKNSTNSIEHSYKSIELVEKNIGELLELFYEMQEDKNIDKEMTKKEDTLIQSLEELTTSAKKLKELKTDLDNLLSP
jgi:predicted PurR-regulated permease PerM